MLSKLKRMLGLGNKPATRTAQSVVSTTALGSSQKVSEWANLQGLSFSDRNGGRSYHFEGKIGGKAWRMERGRPSRDFIKGEELRARAELNTRDVAVMVITRQLKDDLDKRAFSLYTDSLQTIADPSLPEEMRWLAMYPEVGWEGLGDAFLKHYAILADEREHAVAWLSQDLAQSLMAWPSMDPSSPKILMLLRGKAYLRMEYIQNDMATMEHATVVFKTACELALSSFSDDLPR